LLRHFATLGFPGGCRRFSQPHPPKEIYVARLIDHPTTANHVVHQVPANGVPAERPAAVTVGVCVMHVKIGKRIFVRKL
ncbi:MAG: hypothetical protein AB1330_12195, partial [Bacillota bacterium]